jgi:hypothetical protein
MTENRDKDHKTKNTYKAFWIRAALAYNSCTETREDETELVLVEKATSPARNGEIVVGPGARPANCAILFPGSDNNNNNDDNSDSGSDSSPSSSGGGKLLAVDNVEDNSLDNGGAIDDFGTIVVSLTMNTCWSRRVTPMSTFVR